jgi:carboxysome shell carbonic anhydrase
MMTATHSRRVRPGAGIYGPGSYGAAPLALTDPHVALFGRMPDTTALAHPLHDPAHNRRLLEREDEITTAFAAIEPVLKEVAVVQYQDGYADRIQELMRSRLGFELPASCLTASWIKPLNMRGLYAYSVFQTFRRLAERDFDRSSASLAEGEPADEVIRKWGFHAIDIAPCADGRLSGVVDYILRVPPSVVAYRKSFAGALFDVEEGLRHWEEIELRRHREGVPNRADEATRYLKIGVYHTSSSDPAHEGCAAHGSDERKSAQALLDRLNAFAQAIENTHCCGASVATLLIGVDTDSDAIRLHVPDARGAMSPERYVDNRVLFEATHDMGREQAKEAIRIAVAEAAGAAPDDAATEGMRWFCGYLLKNNMAQIEYVRAYHGGRYADLGHTERFITVGDSFDDVQLRNLAYQAQMETIEEGAADMDVGIKIFRRVNMARDLPIPVFVHFRYDGKVPGSRERAARRGQRLERAIHTRYPDLAREGWLYTYATVQDRASGGRLEDVSAQDSPAGRRCACECNDPESRQ